MTGHRASVFSGITQTLSFYAPPVTMSVDAEGIIVKYLRLARALLLSGAMVAGSASACTADVESTAIESAGKDMLLTFRIAPDSAGAATVRFQVTVRYMSNGEPHSQAYTFTEQVTGTQRRIVPAVAEFEVTEVGAVRIDSVSCAP